MVRQVNRLSSKLLFCVFSAFLFCVSFALPAQGAGIIFGAHSREAGLGKALEVGVFVDPEGQAINAVESKIIFPADSLELLDIRDGNSILNLWLERPHLERPGEVVFSGIVPGGFVSNQGYLFSLVFRPKKEGQIAVTTADERILLNDGTGTGASIRRGPLPLTIVKESGGEEFLPPFDEDPPESFTPEVARDPNVFNGKYFLVFVTQDKGSGIDHYEIQETKSKEPKKRGWVVGGSPYLLKDQKLNSYIFVKAVDRKGNERITMLPPQNPLPFYKNYWLWIIIILVGLLIWYLGIRRGLWPRLRL